MDIGQDRGNDQITKSTLRRQTATEEISLRPIGRGVQTLEQQDVVSASQGSLLRNG